MSAFGDMVTKAYSKNTELADLEEQNADLEEQNDLLAADNARLKETIKKAEWYGWYYSDEREACPWCGELEYTYAPGWVRIPGKHAPDCHAFTPEGEVK